MGFLWKKGTESSKKVSGTAKRGRRELSSIRLAIPASRSAVIPQLNRAAERLFQHGLELDVSERTFLFQMCTNAFEFVVVDVWEVLDVGGAAYNEPKAGWLVAQSGNGWDGGRRWVTALLNSLAGTDSDLL